MNQPQLSLDLAREAGHAAGNHCVAKAESRGFDPDRCSDFMVTHLRRNGPTSGEDLTDASQLAGYVPHDLRAFGPIIQTLVRRGVIESYGDCNRRRGHGTRGGIIWRLVKKGAR